MKNYFTTISLISALIAIALLYNAVKLYIEKPPNNNPVVIVDDATLGYLNSKIDSAINSMMMEQLVRTYDNPDTNINGLKRDIQELVRMTSERPENLIELNKIKAELEALKSSLAEARLNFDNQLNRMTTLYISLVGVFTLIMALTSFFTYKFSKSAVKETS